MENGNQVMCTHLHNKARAGYRTRFSAILSSASYLGKAATKDLHCLAPAMAAALLLPRL